MPQDPGSPSVGPDQIPDTRARADLRNDCFEITGRALASNVSDSNGAGPIARFQKLDDHVGWSSLYGTTEESISETSIADQAWTSSSQRAPNAACSTLMPLFVLSQVGEGKDRIEYAMYIEHHVPDFAYPANLASAPPADVAIPVKVSSALHIDYRRAFIRSDGTVDPDFTITRPGEAQSWDLETTCATPFTVTPHMEQRFEVPEGGDSFCEPANAGSFKCLTFQFDYTGDHCDFVARNTAITLPNGSSVKATFAGYFDRAPADSSGYRIKVTNMEIH
jgi:hypothetical protein